MKALFKRNIPNDNFVDMMTRILKVLITASALVLYGTVSLAQDAARQSGTGQIEGIVTDAITGETLIGVNVVIDGTSIGSASNVDGEYILRRVPAGTQTLIVSYIGYERIEETIEVEAGETLEYNAELTPSAVEGVEVVVSSQARGQRTAINEQLSSRTISNVVSSEKIRELPDENAATAVSRLPGISLQEGDKVVVRGLQAKLNTITVNGIQLPSTSAGDRSTNLGFISSNMLSGIEVTKAVTPDMDANSIGGNVNLRLQEAPEGLNFDVMGQGGYNSQDRTYDNYQVWASVSNRFFDDKLGVFVQGNSRRVNGGGDVGSANYTYLGPESGNDEYGARTLGIESFDYVDQVNITDEIGGSIITDFRLPEGKIVLQNTYAYTSDDNTSHRDLLFFNNNRRQFRVSRDIFDKSLLVNALQAENDFGFVKIDAGVSHAFSDKGTDLRYGDPGDEFGFVNSSVQPFEPRSTQDRLTMGPEEVFDMELNSAEETWRDASIIENGVVWDESFSERQLGTKLNLTFPTSFSDNVSGEFKLGGSYKYTNRENDRDRTSTRLTQISGSNYSPATREYLESIGASLPMRLGAFRDEGYERGDYFLNGRHSMDYVVDVDLMDEFMRIATEGWNAPGYHLPQSTAFDYTGDETLTALYGMGEFKFGTKFTLLAGLRYEQLNMQYDANFVYQTDDVNGTGRIVNNPDEEPETPEEIERLERAKELTQSDVNHSHLFPNVQVRYEATDWFDVRLAYTKTISRPDYSALLPSIFREGNDGSGQAGNPYLEPAVSQNFDAYFSFYNNEIGLFTVGGFYKEIEDILINESRLYAALPEGVAYPEPETFNSLGLQEPNSGARISTYFNNPEPADIYGLEFDWQTHFWYLPQPFNNMILNVNYTRTFSEMDYQQITFREQFDPGPPPRNVAVEVDTLRNARLIQQGNHLINVALGADYKGFSGRLSFRMQGDVLTGLGVRPEEDSFTGNTYNWDFTIRQSLPVEGLSLFVNGINIFHNPVKDYRRFSRGYTYAEDGSVLDQNIERNLRQVAYYPRRFQLGLRYSF